MATPKEYIRLKRKVEEAQKAADHAEGALAEVMGRIQHTFGCSTLKAAKKKLIQLRTKEAELKKEFETAVAEYEKKWEGQDEADMD